MKRVFLFLATNLAVLLVLSTVMKVLGLERILTQQGIDISLGGLLLFCAVFGMLGSLISLLLSKWAARMATRAHVIESPSSDLEQWLVATVRDQAKAAGIGMPEVAVYDSPDVNAFATGWNPDKALVAVSTGLLYAMERQETEAVLAHEVSHVANGDMVTLALLQGVVNTFVLFFARVVGLVFDRAGAGGERRGYGAGYWLTIVVLEIFFGILASMIVMWFSRYREFRADAGGAQLAGRDAMIAALERLQTIHQPTALPRQLVAFGISAGIKRSMTRLFMSHPPLESRIEALRSPNEPSLREAA